MGYEIPQKLEYKEKIIFGLTFKQLAYLMLFAPLIFLVSIRSNMHIFFKIFFSMNLSAMGVGFIFLDLDRHLKIWIEWFKTRVIETPKKLSKFIPIKEIRDNLLVTTDGRKIAVLKIDPVNFSIKPKTAKEAITMAFQKFLNSLDFPVQIIMNTEKLDLQEYLNEVNKKIKENEQFRELFEEYKAHLITLSSKNDVMNRNFYLMIPERSDIEIQVKICQEKLGNLGLKNARVNERGLRELLEKFFESGGENPFSKFFERMANSSVRSVFPKKIENYSSHIKIGDTLSRTIYARGYPRNVEAGFLDKIVSSQGDFDLSLYVEPYNIETTMIMLNKELQKQRADLYSAKIKGSLNPSLEIKYEDTKAVLRNLQKGEEKLFNISLYINCRAKTKEELDLLTKKIEAELNSLMIIPGKPMFRMAQGFQSCSPLALDSLKMNRNVTTGALSAFFPFTSSFLQADKTGVWLGQNRNNIPIIKDIFNLSNPNGICLASSGSGKSYMAKLLISRYLLNGVKVMVIDPQGEYRGLVERFEGQRIDLSRTSETMINPLDLMGHDYSEKRLALMDLMPIMLGDLTEPQKSFIDKALTEAYERNGITDKPETWNNEPPILEDVLHILEKMEKTAINLEKTTLRSLINRLSMYVTGVFSFLNRQTNIDFDNKFVCFDIGSMPKQVKPAIMFLVLDYIYMKMRESLERKLLVIDEAWSLLGRTEDASYIFEIVKTCRKFNLALFLINQEVEGMLNSEAGKSVLANSSYTLLMKQKPAVIRNIQKTFFLSESERAHLLTAGVGEGILLMDDEHSEIRIVASDKEHNLITTNADELLKQESTKDKKAVKRSSKKKPSVKISVDSEKGFYRLKDLEQKDIKYLKMKGYKTWKFQNVQSEKEDYLLKPEKGKSKEHFFLIRDIGEYLGKFTDKIEYLESVGPDIIFEIGGEKYAIEVETGKNLKDKEKVRKKVESLKEKYGDRWLFVVTNRNFAGVYNSFGTAFTRKTFVKNFEKWIKKA